MTLQVQTEPTLPRPRLLYVGDVPVRNDASGGSIVLWRHQQMLRDFVLEEQLVSKWSANSCSWISKGLRRCRLSRLELILRPWIQSLTHHIAPEHVQQIRSHYVGILTVAHGTRWLEAMKLAELSGLPLISIFHDWYPDASGCPKGWTWVWDQWFRKLYQRSALAFVVSPGMGRELGDHPNSHLLPPIPANSESFKAKAGDSTLTPADSSRVRLYYAGHSGGLYAPMLRELIQAVQGDERFQLRISGSETAQLAEFSQKGKVEVLGFLNGDEWQRAFEEADLLLVVLPFEKRRERHLRTHFPSKLVEYANRGRPILIWGPETSSAVSWARDASNVLICTSQHVEALLETAAELAVPSRSGRNGVVGTTIRDEKIRFEPELIHKNFEYQLKRLALGVSQHH